MSKIQLPRYTKIVKSQTEIIVIKTTYGIDNLRTGQILQGNQYGLDCKDVKEFTYIT